MALIQDDLYLYASLVSIQQGFGNRSGGEGVGLNKNGALGFVQLPDNGIGAASVWGEVDLPGTGGGLFLGEGNGWRENNQEGYGKDSK